jgi:competence protein ComEC
MLLLSIAFLAGVLALQSCSELPAWNLYPVIVAALLLLRWRATKIPAVFMLGFLWAALYAEITLAPFPDEALEGQTILIEGTVLDIPRQFPASKIRFPFYVDRLKSGNGWLAINAKVRLNWYGPVRIPVAGETWQLMVRLKRPHGFSNPGGFDYERWLFQQGIRATGYVRKDSHNKKTSESNINIIKRLRYRLIAFLEDSGSSLPAASMVQALTIGDRGRISPNQWDTLRATGTAHLMAISGLHISLVAGLVFWWVRIIWLRCGRFVEAVPARKVAAACALVAGLFYAMLSGFGIPAQRALIMVSVLMLAIVSDRTSSLMYAVSIAAILTLLVDPSSVLSAGWWLSFWAVTVIAYVTSGRQGEQGAARKWGVMHVVLTICMFPLLLDIFQQASLIAPIANFVAVPWVGMVVVPLALIGTLVFTISESVGGALLNASAWLLDLIWPGLEWLAGLEFALWQQHQPVVWTLPVAIAGVLLIFIPRGFPGRWVGLLLIVPMFLVQPAAPKQGDVWVTLLDVGQGLSTIIQTERHTLVYDTGPKFSATFDTGQAVIVPFLRFQGIRRVDTLIISHGDNDHIGGARSLLEQYPASRIISSVPGELPDSKVMPCRRGDHWQWDGVRFAILHPETGDGYEGNNASCVLRVEIPNGQSVLLTGDIEKPVEQTLLDQQRDKLPADILIVPHHGSKTSSTKKFIEVVNPTFALFPAGYRNRYHFPVPAVVERYASKGVTMYETGQQGAITLKLASTSGKPEIRLQRDESPHYWDLANYP